MLARHRAHKDALLGREREGALDSQRDLPRRQLEREPAQPEALGLSVAIGAHMHAASLVLVTS